MVLIPLNIFLIKKIFLMFTFERERKRETDRQHKQGRDRERGRHRIRRRLQVLSCQHRAGRGAQTHEPWDHDLNQSWRLNWLSHPGAFPLNISLFHSKYFQHCTRIGWFSWLIVDFCSGHDLTIHEIRPCCRACLGFSLSLPLRCLCSLTLSQK